MEDTTYLVYDPHTREWLRYADGARAWTSNNREAHIFPTYHSANVTRNQIERDGDKGDYELYVTKCCHQPEAEIA